MISKPILYKNADEQHYKAEFYFYIRKAETEACPA
jgi:hypothetical protein